MVKESKYNIEYFKKFAEEKGSVCLSDEYKNNKTPLLWQCDKEHTWPAQPRKIIEGSWCPECFNLRNRKYFVNENIFEQNTEKSFYLAGFLAADGWKTRSSDSYLIGLELAIKDLNHLNKISELFEFTGNLKYRKRLPNDLVKTENESYSLLFNSKKIFSDLERFNVVERKTYIYYMPQWLKNHSLVHHFMRGYIDGDGCYYIGHNKGQEFHVAFTLKGTVQLLKDFYEIFTRNGVIGYEAKRNEIVAKAGKKYLAFSELKYGGNGVMNKMYNFLYKDAVIYLERKKEVIRLAKDWVIYGTDRKRVPKYNSFGLTKEVLLEKATEFKSQKKMAEYFGCTSANISWATKELNIRDEFKKALGIPSKKEIVEAYKELGTYTAVAKKFDYTVTRISQIMKEISA